MKNTNYTVIYGFDKYGYTVQVLKNGAIVDEYEAGNSPYDSTSVIENGLSLVSIEHYAKSTAAEFAAEYNCKFAECPSVAEERQELRAEIV